MRIGVLAPNTGERSRADRPRARFRESREHVRDLCAIGGTQHRGRLEKQLDPLPPAGNQACARPGTRTLSSPARTRCVPCCRD
jgi:hypothetical protein